MRPRWRVGLMALRPSHHSVVTACGRTWTTSLHKKMPKRPTMMMTTFNSNTSSMTPPPTASVVTISYHDLKSFNASVDSPSNNALIEQIGKAFGKANNDKNNNGDNYDKEWGSLGILAVQDIPQFAKLRQRLLPLAARLPTLPDLQDVLVLPETLYSTGWSHGKEILGGKPDLAKGSFYANPLHDSLLQAMIQRHHHHTNTSNNNDNDDTFIQELKAQARRHPEFYADNVWPEQSLPELRHAFMDLGRCMVETGRFVAAVCDAYCAKQSGNGDDALQLCKTLTESLNCKGRLLHYFPVQQQQQQESSTSSSDDMDENLWCGWHNDHGSLTALAPAMYMNEKGDIVNDNNSNPDATTAGGLYIQSRSGRVVRICLPPTACGFQIGETSQIQSGGLLQATPHAVRPGNSNCNSMTYSRESFAVFMEPEFNTPLNIPVGKTVHDCQEHDVKLPGTVLPLRLRWKPGQTFGDFHVATVTAFCSNDNEDKDTAR